MTQDLEYFLHERATNLAIVYLTRSPDVLVKRLDRDYGIDLLVNILRDQLPTGRVFGVKLKTQDQAFKTVQPSVFLALSQQERTCIQELPFPVCLFLFTMADDKGYCQWLNGFSSTQNFHALEQSQWHSLDRYLMSDMLTVVNAWYQERQNSAA